jgi:hypothetical protein
MSVRPLAAATAVVLTLGAPRSADAHRLDEYLQATRLSIGAVRIVVQIDVTPGIALADTARRAVDTDGDGAISAAEAGRYARSVIDRLTLSIDGRPARIELTTQEFPDPREFDLGVGTIRLRAEAAMPTAGSGRHRLTYANGYDPEKSVYLVNALAPADARVRITAQDRDAAQRRVTIDYEVENPLAWRLTLLAGGTALLGLLLAGRRFTNSPIHQLTNSPTRQLL